MPSPSPTVHHPGVADLAPILERALAGDRPAPTRDGRPAAVLIALFDHDGEAHLLLTKRAAHLSAHPGQISLPGGSCEPADADPTATALRETHEELGLPPERFTVVGRLEPVHTQVSGFLVHPVVAIADGPLEAVPADGEVAQVLVVPVAHVVAVDRTLPPDAGVASLRYPLGGEDVWGATARILRVFCVALTAGWRNG